jgi:hypothetical protein
LAFRRLHNQRPALPSSRQTFYKRILLFQPERFDHSVSSISDQIRKRHLLLAQSSGRFRRLEIARGRRDCPRRVVKLYLRGLLGERSHRPDAVLRMAHLHTDMERLDIHVALEVCEMVGWDLVISVISAVKRLVNEKPAHFLKYLVEFLRRHFSNGVENDVLFDGEKALRPNEAGLIDLAAFTIAVIQRNGEGIPMCATRDLAEN